MAVTRLAGHRRQAVLAAVLLVGLWWLVGASWWPPAVALATALLVGLLGRLLPGELRHPLIAAGAGGLVALAPELPVARAATPNPNSRCAEPCTPSA